MNKTTDVKKTQSKSSNLAKPNITSKNHTNKSSKLVYDSNPFTLSFSALGNLIKYANGVFIAVLVIGFLNTGLNLTNSIFEDNSNTAETNIMNLDRGNEMDTSINEETEVFSEKNDQIEVYSDFESNNNNFLTRNESLNDFNPAWIAPMALGVLLVLIIMALVILIIYTAYSGFVAAAVLSSNEKRPISFSDSFAEMSSRFRVLFSANVISGLRILGGFLLLVVPGIRAHLRYSAVPFIVMSNKNLSAKESVELSKSIYDGHLMEVFGIKTVGSIIPFIGDALNFSGMGLSLKQISAYKAANKQVPATHWLNYLGIILIGIILLFVPALLILAIAYLK